MIVLAVRSRSNHQTNMSFL